MITAKISHWSGIRRQSGLEAEGAVAGSTPASGDASGNPLDSLVGCGADNGGQPGIGSSTG
jgi:hypothetical protein